MSLTLTQFKTININAMLAHPRRNFSSSFTLKVKFTYSELVDKRARGVDMDRTRGFIKESPNMVNKLNSGQKLDEREVELAAHVGIKCENGIPVAEDRQILEDFSQNQDDVREYTNDIRENKKDMEKMIKDKSEYQDSSDITGECELPEYYGDD